MLLILVALLAFDATMASALILFPGTPSQIRDNIDPADTNPALGIIDFGNVAVPFAPGVSISGELRRTTFGWSFTATPPALAGTITDGAAPVVLNDYILFMNDVIQLKPTVSVTPAPSALGGSISRAGQDLTGTEFFSFRAFLTNGAMTDPFYTTWHATDADKQKNSTPLSQNFPPNSQPVITPKGTPTNTLGQWIRFGMASNETFSWPNSLDFNICDTALPSCFDASSAPPDPLPITIPAPGPATILLFGSGLAGLAILIWSRHRPT